MVFSQTNFVVKDVPGDWEEVIYLLGISVNFGAQTNQVFTLKHGGRLRSISATIIGLTNTARLICRILNSDSTYPSYGEVLDGAIGLQIQVTNFDTAINESNLSVCVVLKGG